MNRIEKKDLDKLETMFRWMWDHCESFKDGNEFFFVTKVVRTETGLNVTFTKMGTLEDKIIEIESL